MSEQELVRIESALNLRLPRAYRDLMLQYPFSPDSFTAECLPIEEESRQEEMAARRKRWWQFWRRA